MPVAVDADLRVEESGSQRNLNVNDFATTATGGATQATLAAVLAAVDGLEVTLTDVDLNTDQVEAQLTSIFTELLAKLEAGDITGLATAAKQDTEILRLEAVRDRLPSALDNGSLNVADAYTAGQALASQTGTGAVLTFSFSAARDLIWVRSVGEVSYADPFGGTPANGTGVYIADDEPTPLTVRASSVKVWAPSGATVFAWGYGS